jgi:hypothetical protein
VHSVLDMRTTLSNSEIAGVVFTVPLGILLFAMSCLPRRLSSHRHRLRHPRRHPHYCPRHTASVPRSPRGYREIHERMPGPNVIGNGVATTVVSRRENELDPAILGEVLTRPLENGETKST